MKLNGNKNIILDGDVMITSPSKIGKTLGEVIDEQQQDINKLKSNVKYIYSYGGVGGTGSGGGSGSSNTSSNPQLFVTFNYKEIGDTPILLNGEGVYELYAKVRKSGGNKFYLKVATGDNPNINIAPMIELSTEKNNCEHIEKIRLTNNGMIRIQLIDSDGDVVGHTIDQYYLLNSHEFSSSFKCVSENGDKIVEDNEYLMSSISGYSDPFIEINYRINISGSSNVKINVDIEDYVVPTFEMGDKLSDILKIKLDDIDGKGTSLIGDDKSGKYHVTLKLSYINNLGEDVYETKGYDITLIPGSLFISVVDDKNASYDTLDKLMLDCDIDDSDSDSNVDWKKYIPSRTINNGEYLSYYLKVFEGAYTNGGRPLTYNVECRVSNLNENTGNFEIDNNVKKDITLTERLENKKGLSLSFSTTGIKRIEFTVNSQKGGVPYEKYVYIYVKKNEGTKNWGLPKEKGFLSEEFYFRANQGDETYLNFPELSSHSDALELKTNSNTVTLLHDKWKESSHGASTTTILSFGIQLNSINVDNCKILELYSENISNAKPAFILSSKKLFDYDTDDNDILIPSSVMYNSSDSKNYHLVQIVRQKIIGKENEFINLLYIDGSLECCDFEKYPQYLKIEKIILNNINISYNLINIQYLSQKGTTDKDLLDVDAWIYEYWLSYKEKFINVNEIEKITEDENTIYSLMNNLVFDGENLITSMSTVESIAPKISIPTMVFDYCPGTNTDGTNNTENALIDISKVSSDDTSYDEKYKKSWQKFMSDFLKGYAPGDSNTFGRKPIRLRWSNGNSDLLKEEVIPQVNGLVANWEFEFQGTSTMTNRIKNFSLYCVTSSTNNEQNLSVLFSPNFKKGTDKEAVKTFLPEKEWTIKADIADSAHANNTCMGKFVNNTCTKFNIGNVSDVISKRIRNTLEGFPILLFFRCDDDNRVFFFGVYNFNLGRGSEYNLGYTTDIENVYNNASEAGSLTNNKFAYSYGSCIRNQELAIGEIQENDNKFDFSQYHESVLFNSFTNGSNKATMFGKDEKITASNLVGAKTHLKELVLGVATAGRFVFQEMGKQFGTLDDGYTYKDGVGYVPDTVNQIHINGEYEESFNEGISVGYMTNLLELITSQKTVGEDAVTNIPLLNYTSASEYYTICVAFGLVDSVLKNMNLKSWNGRTFYVAFYDMDCALGEDNAGKEKVSSLALTDQWSATKNGDLLGPVKIEYDYWNREVGGQGFDYTSSYLFGVVKYAQAILSNYNDTNNIKLSHYPQEFWAILRGWQGELRNVDYFIENYYLSGVHKIPAFLVSLNYRIKYLYSGEVYNDEDKTYIRRDIANVEAFHGTRKYKVREWLDRRIKFLDAVMNVNNLTMKLPSGIELPKISSELYSAVSSNPNVLILQDAFSSNNDNAIHTPYNNVNVKIKASKNTPMIITKGGDVSMYLLGNNTDEYDIIKFTTSQTVRTRFLGSKDFIEIENGIEPFITSYYTILSNKLTSIVYGDREVNTLTGGLTIISPTVEKISLPIKKWSGNLNISKENNNGISVNYIDISNSGLYCDFSNLPSLQYVNISSIKADGKEINFSGSKLLRGDNIIISGENDDNKTKFYKLNIIKIPGNFSISNTEIDTIIASSDDEHTGGSFNINGDEYLKNVDFDKYNSISITNCKNLEEVIIKGDECTSVSISRNEKLVRVNSTEPGVFDFSNLHNLSTLYVSNCVGVKKIILPNRTVKVYTNGLSGNTNLQYIDTEEDSKIEICGSGVFSNCNLYGMRQSSGKYTEMTVGENVTSLERTFERSVGNDDNNFSITDVKHFIDNIDVDVKRQITSLYRCFYNRSGVKYTIGDAKGDRNTYETYPDMREFNNLTNISYMFYGTGVNFLHAGMFNFNSGVIDDTKDLNWDMFISGNERNISEDTFKYIKFRIMSINNSKFNVYKYDTSTTRYQLITNDEIDFTNILMPDYKNDGVIQDGFKNLKINSLINVNFNDKQKINLNDIISIYPNALYRIENFLNGDLSNFKFGEMFGDGKIPDHENVSAIYSIKQSFNHNNISNLKEMTPINLNEFFDWSKSNLFSCLFESSTISNLGFAVNKRVDYKDYKNIVNYVCDNQNKYSRLTNLFAFCDITGYDDDSEICLYYNKDGEDNENDVVNNNITIINHLFYNCRCFSDDNLENEVGFYLSSKLFKFIPKVEYLISTFGGVKFSKMFSYDLFGKRYKADEKTVYIVKKGEDPNNDNSWDEATLTPYEYTKVIKNLTKCFADTKFINCPNWFEPTTDEKNELGIDELSYNGDKTYTNTYYLTKENKPRYTFEINGSEESIISSRIEFSNNSSFESIISKDKGIIYCQYNSNIGKYYGYQGDNIVITINDDKVRNGESVSNRYKIKLLRYNVYEYSNRKELINYELTDTEYNYTHYVKEIIGLNNVSLSNDVKLFNHDICGEMFNYKNITNENDFISNYSVLRNLEDNKNYGIYKTFCCLPPDLFYCCSTSDLVIDDVFANSNITGVLPRHLMNNCKNVYLTNVFKNVNILPNVDYFYNSNVNNILNEFDKDETINLPKEYEYDNEGNVVKEITYLTKETDKHCVIFRGNDGILRRRRPIYKRIEQNGGYAVSEILIDKERGQFVYVPSNFTECSSIQNAFNFRFNLPEIAVLESKDGRYTSHYYGDTAVENDNNLYWNAFNQYFFLHKDSVNWDNVTNASSPFISSIDDVDYISLNNRIGNINLNNDERGYSWWKNLPNSWRTNESQTNGKFNIFLNLCCDKDNKGLLIDNGLPINLTIYTKFDNLVSDCISAFISGRIFDKDFYISEVKSANLSSSIVNGGRGYLGISKNIILPKCEQLNVNFKNLRFFDYKENILKDCLGVGLIDNDNTGADELIQGYGNFPNCNILFIDGILYHNP